MARKQLKKKPKKKPKKKVDEVRTTVVLKPETSKFLKRMKKEGSDEIKYPFVSMGQTIDYLVEKYKELTNRK